MGRSEGVSPEKSAGGFSEELKLERCGPARGGKGRHSDRGLAAGGWGAEAWRRQQAWLIRGTQKEVQLAGCKGFPTLTAHLRMMPVS